MGLLEIGPTYLASSEKGLNEVMRGLDSGSRCIGMLRSLRGSGFKITRGGLSEMLL